MLWACVSARGRASVETWHLTSAQVILERTLNYLDIRTLKEENSFGYQATRQPSTGDVTIGLESDSNDE